MKKYLLSFCLLLLALGARSQQQAMYSQYMTNYFLLNPAVAGFEKDWNLKVGFRNQWVGFEGAPRTFYLSGETALFKGRRRRRDKGHHGAGGYLYADKTGPSSRSGVLLSYAYHVPLAENLYLSGGLFAGVQQFRFDPNQVHLADNSNHLDPVSMQGGCRPCCPT
jgi:type IX secretion system PorP/SprF family membrane protein